MPYYEYDCGQCGAAFERRLKVEQRLEPQPCPSCGARASTLRMSLPALVGGSAPAQGMSPAGVCPSTGVACGCGHAHRN